MLVAGQVVYRDYEIEWQRGVTKPGDTAKIRNPASFESKDFNAGSGIEIQNLTESSSTWWTRNARTFPWK